MRIHLWSCVVIAVAAGCHQTLPPPATPATVAPTVGAMPPPAEGSGRVIIDVVDGPTDIYRAEAEDIVVGYDKDRPIIVEDVDMARLCTSPCGVDLPLGQWTLAFPTPGGSGRFELDEVDVVPSPSVYRRDLGSFESPGAGLPLGIVATTFGGISLVCAATFLPLGFALDEGDAFLTAGLVTLAAGAVLTALGVWGIVSSPFVEQSGAGVQFPLPASP